jgi:head-tail adaptor
MSEFAGTLRERIIVERPISVRNEMGLQEPGWEEVCRCLAAVALDSVGQESEGQALSAMSRFRVTVRWGARNLMVRQLIDDPLKEDRISMRCEEVRA